MTMTANLARRRTGLGDLTDQTLQNDAIALLDDLSSNGCSTSADASVSTFQTAYNAAGGSPALSVDGLYGNDTSAALQAVINGNSGNSGLANKTAPAGCVGAGTSTPTVTGGVASSTGTMNYTPWLIGAGVVGAGVIAYAVHRRHSGKGLRRRTA